MVKLWMRCFSSLAFLCSSERIVMRCSIFVLFEVFIEGFKLILQVNYPVGAVPNHPPAMYSPDELPKNVARTLNQGSCVMSMDFHPIQQMILLGTFV